MEHLIFSWYSTFAISIALKSHGEITSGLIFDPIKMKCFMQKKIMEFI